ncbi:MAG: hypothetical protein ACJA0H_000254 [Francisellaceae bacterium]|jgi:hypothetical protein
MHLIISDLGDDGIALIQWAFNQQLDNIQVLYVDTNWQSNYWKKRITQVENWCVKLDLKFNIIQPQADFRRQVIEHNQFPSIKFQWCAGLIKGIAMIDWLEIHDDTEEAIILLPNRKDMSLSQTIIEEKIEENEYYNERQTWYPLINYTEKQRNDLINLTPFDKIEKPAESCSPCIYNISRQLRTLSVKDIEKTHSLEQKISKPMFNADIKNLIVEEKKSSENNQEENYYDAYATGCGWNYGCGL